MRNRLAYLWAANQEIRYDICTNTLHTIVRKVFLECFFIECGLFVLTLTHTHADERRKKM